MLNGDKKQIQLCTQYVLSLLLHLNFLAAQGSLVVFYTEYVQTSVHVGKQCHPWGKSDNEGLEPHGPMDAVPKEMQSRKKIKKGLSLNVGSFTVCVCWARFSEISRLNINQSKCKLSVTPNSHQLILSY